MKQTPPGSASDQNGCCMDDERGRAEAEGAGRGALLSDERCGDGVEFLAHGFVE